LAAIKKQILATKAGEAGFKVGVEGCYTNGNATIGESFKMIEDAITNSGANDEGRKIFQIGINCDGDSSFNKDPKEPNKYEQEGQKLQFDSNAMIDYYCKIINDHPLVTYIEDAFSIFDFAGHRELRKKLSNDFPNVNMSLKAVFAKGGLKRMKLVTDFQEFSG
jgi:enolase